VRRRRDGLDWEALAADIAVEAGLATLLSAPGPSHRPRELGLAGSADEEVLIGPQPVSTADLLVDARRPVDPHLEPRNLETVPEIGSVQTYVTPLTEQSLAFDRIGDRRILVSRRVHAERNADDGYPAGPERLAQLAHHTQVVVDVFEHVRAERDVEGSGPDREVPGVADHVDVPAFRSQVHPYVSDARETAQSPRERRPRRDVEQANGPIAEKPVLLQMEPESTVASLGVAPRAVAVAVGANCAPPTDEAT
jgi:hypothetical protein